MCHFMITNFVNKVNAMYNITGTVKMMIYVTILHFLYSFDGFLEFNFRFTL